MRRRISERGQASIELLLMLPAILLLGLVVWQVHLTLTVANDAENAARTAARKGGGAAAARAALEPQYRDNITPCKAGETRMRHPGGGPLREDLGRRAHHRAGRLEPRAGPQGPRRGAHAGGALTWA